MQGDEFIAAIRSNPTCTQTRLIYADWLEECGDAKAAEYLRAECALAGASRRANPAKLRERLWRARADVPTHWLDVFAQPRMLLANPTPYLSAWRNFGLGRLRPCEPAATYDSWPYESLPEMKHSDLRNALSFLSDWPPDIASRDMGPENEGEAERNVDERQLEETLSHAADLGFRLPNAYRTLLLDSRLQFPSATGCYFHSSDLQLASLSDAVSLPFYTDSQDCLVWDLCVHKSGSHCIIARVPEALLKRRKRKDAKNPSAWFVAPTLEAFLLRMWIENQVDRIVGRRRLCELLDVPFEEPPPPPSCVRAYMEYYAVRLDPSASS